MNTFIFFSKWFMIAFLPIVTIEANSLTNNYVVTTQSTNSIVLESCCKDKQHRNWKFCNRFLFFNWIPIDSGLGDTVSLDTNRSLIISNISLLHEGTYQCMCDNVSLRTFLLWVQG